VQERDLPTYAPVSVNVEPPPAVRVALSQMCKSLAEVTIAQAEEDSSVQAYDALLEWTPAHEESFPDDFGDDEPCRVSELSPEEAQALAAFLRQDSIIEERPSGLDLDIWQRLGFDSYTILNRIINLLSQRQTQRCFDLIPQECQKTVFDMAEAIFQVSETDKSRDIILEQVSLNWLFRLEAAKYLAEKNGYAVARSVEPVDKRSIIAVTEHGTIIEINEDRGVLDERTVGRGEMIDGKWEPESQPPYVSYRADRIDGRRDGKKSICLDGEWNDGLLIGSVFSFGQWGAIEEATTSKIIFLALKQEG